MIFLFSILIVKYFCFLLCWFLTFDWHCKINKFDLNQLYGVLQTLQLVKKLLFFGRQAAQKGSLQWKYHCIRSLILIFSQRGSPYTYSADRTEGANYNTQVNIQSTPLVWTSPSTHPPYSSKKNLIVHITATPFHITSASRLSTRWSSSTINPVHLMSNLVSGGANFELKGAWKSLMHFVIKSWALARASEKMSTAAPRLHKLSHAPLSNF